MLRNLSCPAVSHIYEICHIKQNQKENHKLPIQLVTGEFEKLFFKVKQEFQVQSLKIARLKYGGIISL